MVMVVKKKITLFTIFLGIILIAVGVCYMYFNQSEVNKSNPVKTLTINEYNKRLIALKEVTEYFDLFFSDEYPIADMEKLSEKQKTLFVLKTVCNYKNKSITTDKLEEESLKYFKPFKLYLYDIIIDNKTLYKYSEKKFVYNKTAENKYSLQTINISDKGDTNSFTLTKKYYYLKSEIVNGKYINKVFTTEEDYKNDNNSIYEVVSDISTLIPSDYTKILDELKTITYNFVRYNNDYISKSITIK